MAAKDDIIALMQAYANAAGDLDLIRAIGDPDDGPIELRNETVDIGIAFTIPGVMDALIEAIASVLGGGGGVGSPKLTIFDDFYTLQGGSIAGGEGSGWEKITNETGEAFINSGGADVTQYGGAGLLFLRVQSGGNPGTHEVQVVDSTPFFSGKHNPIMRARVRTHSDFNNARLNFGFSDYGAASYAFIQTADNGVGWNTYCKSGSGGETDQDLNVGPNPSTDTWYDIRIELEEDSEVRFYVNDTLISTLDATDSVPNEEDSLSRYMYLLRTNGHGFVFVDYYELQIDRIV
jgi:hypothetical protein